MLYLNLFENFNVDPFGEEDWNETDFDGTFYHF